jgi:hypothetical protein
VILYCLLACWFARSSQHSSNGEFDPYEIGTQRDILNVVFNREEARRETVRKSDKTRKLLETAAAMQNRND